MTTWRSRFLPSCGSTFNTWNSKTARPICIKPQKERKHGVSRVASFIKGPNPHVKHITCASLPFTFHHLKLSHVDTSNCKPRAKSGSPDFVAVRFCRGSQVLSCITLKSSLQADKVDSYFSLCLVVARAGRNLRGRNKSIPVTSKEVTNKKWRSHFHMSPLDGSVGLWIPQALLGVAVQWSRKTRFSSHLSREINGPILPGLTQRWSLRLPPPQED